MHLKQLQYTVEVAKCKSFSKAAKKLYVSQPSLSTSISSFEEELGMTIFYRTTSGVILTKDGEKILPKIEEILNHLEQLSSLSEQTLSKYTTTLAAIPASCNGLVINLLGILARDNPEITLNILEIRPQKVLSSITNGLADLVIGSYTAESYKQTMMDIQKNNLVLEPLFDDYLYVFLPRNHRLANRPSISLKELFQERQATFNDFLLLESTDCSPEEEKNLSEYYSFSDRSSIKQAVANGIAYAILPHQMVLDDIYVNSGLIKAIPINNNPTKLTNYLAYRKSSYTPKQEQLIIEQIKLLAAQTQERLAKISAPIANLADESSICRY